MGLTSVLNNHLIFISETDTHYIYRCPFCGDSVNPNHGHLYISKEQPVFYCVRCGTGGSLQKLLRFIKSSAADKPDIIRSLYKEVKTEFKPIDRNFNDVLQIIGEPGPKQKAYIEKRICEIPDWITSNWSVLSIAKEKYSEPNGISFITLRGKYKITRFFSGTMRYKTVKLNKNIITDIFMFRNFKNIAEARKKPNIVIAEGIFDIMAEFILNSIKVDRDSTLYVAMGSKGKINKIMNDICLLLLKNKFNVIHVLADNDVTDFDYKNAFMRFAKDIIVWRNPFVKDWAGFVS